MLMMMSVLSRKMLLLELVRSLSLLAPPPPFSSLRPYAHGMLRLRFRISALPRLS